MYLGHEKQKLVAVDNGIVAKAKKPAQQSKQVDIENSDSVFFDNHVPSEWVNEVCADSMTNEAEKVS